MFSRANGNTLVIKGKDEFAIRQRGSERATEWTKYDRRIGGKVTKESKALDRRRWLHLSPKPSSTRRVDTFPGGDKEWSRMGQELTRLMTPYGG